MKITKMILFDVLYTALLYFGLYENQEWALRLVLFIAWFSFAFGIMYSIIPTKMHKRELLKTALSHKGFAKYWDNITDILFVITFVVFGHIWLATFLAISKIARRARMSDVVEKNAKEA